MMLPLILLRSSTKILLVLKKANNAYQLASRGKNIQLEKQTARAEILFGSFLVDSISLLPQQVMRLGCLYPCFLKCYIYPANANVAVLPLLTGDLVDDVNLLVTDL